jgi:hypothetical protein
MLSWPLYFPTLACQCCITIALQNIANTLHVLSGKSLVIDGVELELKVFKTVESRMSLAAAMDLF